MLDSFLSITFISKFKNKIFFHFLIKQMLKRIFHLKKNIRMLEEAFLNTSSISLAKGCWANT